MFLLFILFVVGMTVAYILATLIISMSVSTMHFLAVCGMLLFFAWLICPTYGKQQIRQATQIKLQALRKLFP